MSIPITKDVSAGIDDARQELVRFAKKDKNQCWGYFPALTAKNTGLSATKKLHALLPELQINNFTLALNFVRTSLIQQNGDSPYHMDSDSKTALTGDVDTIDSREVWRLLLNLSSEHQRTLGYLDIDTTDAPLQKDGGYIHFVGSTNGHEKFVTLAPRSATHVNGVLFCASKVLHTGKDDINGHFVAGYGYERTI